MRGPHDQQIIAAETPKAKKAAAAARPTSPGGKPLLRMLQLLEARGYEQVAQAAIDNAVPEGDRDLFYSREKAVTSSRSLKLARRKTKKESPAIEGETPSSAASIAETHMAAVEQTGPPTGP